MQNRDEKEDQENYYSEKINRNRSATRGSINKGHLAAIIFKSLSTAEIDTGDRSLLPSCRANVMNFYRQ